MKKQLRIVKKGEDDSNLHYWLSRTPKQRMAELERVRQTVNLRRYGTDQGFQRVYRIIQREW